MLKNNNNYKFWFITGSQALYGPEALQQVEADAKKNGQRFKCSSQFALSD